MGPMGYEAATGIIELTFPRLFTIKVIFTYLSL